MIYLVGANLLLVVVSFIVLLRMVAKTRDQIQEARSSLRVELDVLAKRVDDAERVRQDRIESMEKKFESLKEVVAERLNFVKDMSADFVRKLGKSEEQIKKSEERMKGLVLDNTRSTEKLANDIYNFQREIEKMKEYIRERNIDFEL